MAEKRAKVFYIALGICLIAVLGFILVQNKPSLTGFAVNDYQGQSIQALTIASVCSAQPDIFRTWEISNINAIDIEFNWDVEGTSQNGSAIALAGGNTYLNTTAISGANTLRVFVNESLHGSVLSEGAQCDLPPEPCIENWTCSNWSECMNENQTRTCNDLNACNTTINIPALLQGCEVQNLTLNETLPAENLSSNLTDASEDSSDDETDSESDSEEESSTEKTAKVSAVEKAYEEYLAEKAKYDAARNNQTLNASVNSSANSAKAASVAGAGSKITGAIVSNESSDESSGFSLFRTVGNAIRIPLDSSKKFFEGKSLIYKAAYGIIGVVLAAALIILAFISFRRGRAAPTKNTGYSIIKSSKS